MPRRTGIDKTVVKKVVRSGENRGGAMARKKKHDQRTPLPAKGKIKPGAAKENTERLRKAAEEVKTPAARAAAKEKATAFAEYAEEHGWWTEVKTDKTSGMTTATCKRVDEDGRKEMITAEWNGDRVAKGGVLLVFVDNNRTVVLRNVSAARKHIDGSKTVRREVQERRTRKATRSRHLRALTVNEDGTVAVDDEEDDVTPRYAPVGAHVVDRWFDITVTKEKRAKGKVVRQVIARIEGVGSAQVESQRRIWEADGLTVTVKDRSKAS